MGGAAHAAAERPAVASVASQRPEEKHEMPKTVLVALAVLTVAAGTAVTWTSGGAHPPAGMPPGHPMAPMEGMQGMEMPAPHRRNVRPSGAG
jgi:hypothetical protein